MTRFVDPIRYGAFVKMLTEADPIDLPARRHTWTQPGDPARLERHLPRIVMAWIQRRLVGQELDAQAGPAMKAKRRRRRLAHRVLEMRERSAS
jgi:hypothetical protein